MKWRCKLNEPIVVKTHNYYGMDHVATHDTQFRRCVSRVGVGSIFAIAAACSRRVGVTERMQGDEE